MIWNQRKTVNIWGNWQKQRIGLNRKECFNKSTCYTFQTLGHEPRYKLHRKTTKIYILSILKLLWTTPSLRLQPNFKIKKTCLVTTVYLNSALCAFVHFKNVCASLATTLENVHSWIESGCFLFGEFYFVSSFTQYTSVV